VGQGELLDHGSFREIVVSTAVAVVVVGGDGTISFVSGPAVRALGAGRQVVLEGSRFIDLFVPSEAATMTAYLESLRQLPAGQSRWHEATVQVGDGARVIEMDGVNLQSSPHVTGFVLTVSDVTEQRRRDDQLQTRGARTLSPAYSTGLGSAPSSTFSLVSCPDRLCGVARRRQFQAHQRQPRSRRRR
jgi:PAS domain S-box-containing protein